MSQKNKKSILSQLERLMTHILKWWAQITRRSASWEKTINNARDEIKRAKREQPSLNEQFLKEHWEQTEKKARKQAKNETGEDCSHIPPLTWKQVFEDNYDREEEDENQSHKNKKKKN